MTATPITVDFGIFFIACQLPFPIGKQFQTVIHSSTFSSPTTICISKHLQII